MTSYTRSGQSEPAFTNFAKGDCRLLYIHWLLKKSDAANSVLRIIPTGPQSAGGLPDSECVEGTSPKPPTCPTVSHEAIGGMDELTSALSGVAQATSASSATGTEASHTHDNAEAIGEVTTQLRAGRQDLAADPNDSVTARVVYYLESHTTELLVWLLGRKS